MFVDEELDERFADRPAVLADLRSLGLRSSMTVPLVVRRRALGAITLRRRRVEPALRRGRPGDRARPRPARGDSRRQRAPLPRGAAQGEPGAVRRRGRGVLSELLDYDETLAAIARLAVPRIADWCIVDVVDGAEIRRVAVAAADEVKQRALDELREHYPPTWDSPQPAARALRDGAPVMHRGVQRDRLEETVVDERHLQDHGDTRSALSRRDAAGRARREGRRDHVRVVADAAALQRARSAADGDLATRAASRGRQRAPATRESARPGDQLAFLAEMSSLLASSLDYETTLANVAQLIVPQFADWCAGRTSSARTVRSSASRSCTRTRRRTSGRAARASSIRLTPRSPRAPPAS